MKPLITLIAFAFLVGCASVQTNAGKTLASVAVAVDSAMKGWALHVVANGATEQQQAPVKQAYKDYQMSMALAEQAYLVLVKTGDQSAWSAAKMALTSSQGQLVTVIEKQKAGGK